MEDLWTRFQDFFTQATEARTHLKKGRFPVIVT